MVDANNASRWLGWTTCILLVSSVTIGLGYYLLLRGASSVEAQAQEVARSSEGSPASPRVEVVRPRKGLIDRTTLQPGSVQAFESVDLYAGVSGYLQTLNVDIGDHVKKGAVLAKVDVPELEKQVQRYAALVEQAGAKVVQMNARVVSARAEWEAAKAAVPRAEAMLKSKSAELRYRQLQLQRMRDLASSKSIEDKLVDETTSHRDAVREAEVAAREGVTCAKATEAAMEAKVHAAEADVQVAQADVKVAQAELDKANVYIDFSRIVAPFDGVVTRRTVFPHDFVRAANEGGTQLPLLTVQRTDLMRVVVQVPDRDVPYCDPGDAAFVEIDALPGRRLPAKVSRIASSEDADTRLMHVEIDLPNPTGKICHGMYGKVTIVLDQANSLAIPSGCLVGRAQDGKGQVYVVRDGKACVVPVTLGLDDGLQVAVLTGLKADDTVILHPPSNLADGTAVNAEGQ